MFSNFSSPKKKGMEFVNNFYYFPEGQMLDCNIFLLEDKNSGEIALFDIGNGKSLEGLFEGMKESNLDKNLIKKVFITHEHVDHVLGLYPLMEMMKNDPPEIIAYGETAKILRDGDEAQIFPGNLGISARMFGVEIIPLEITDVTDEKEVFFGDFTFQIHYTPGHSLGSICYHETSKKVLVAGDVVFTGGSFGRFDFPGGSISDLQNSLKYVTGLDVQYLLPGHMGISNNGNQQIASSYKNIQMYGNYY